MILVLQGQTKGMVIDMKKMISFVIALYLTYIPVFGEFYGFVDIKGHWAENEINTLGSAGIISGEYLTLREGDSVLVFYPDREITRAEFTKLIICTLTDKFVQYRGIYSDVSVDWYSDYIQTAYNMGLINGGFTPSDKFEPDKPITREIMAYMTARAFAVMAGNEIPIDDSEYFADYDNISSWAKQDVQRIKQLNIMQGYNNEFNPLSNATRAEAAVVLLRFIECINL